MSDNKNSSKSISKKSIFISIAILIVVVVINIVDIDLSKLLYNENDIERVRKKMKKELKEKYNEPFVVKDIGTRSDDGGTEYVARIYPKSIVGTKKEYDTYYHGSATLDKVNGGLDDEIGDNYGLIKINMGAEKYLIPEAKSIFGKRLLLKTDVKYKQRNKDDFWVWYKKPNFEKVHKISKQQPDSQRIELTLYLYIFDRIDSKQEKENRRKDIFEFVQYLKEEGLFRYLEIKIRFLDERVLATSYEEYKDKMYDTELITRKIEGKTIELPPDSFRIKMSKQLKSEINTMNEKQLIENMKTIRKCEMTYDGIEKYSNQYNVWVESINMLKIDKYIDYEKYKIKNNIKTHKYNKLSDVEFIRDLKYIFKERRKHE